LEYGLQGWFPNGTHPLGVVFVHIDPELADFNIHPAKREARFFDPGAIHHAVTTALKNFCRTTLLQNRHANQNEEYGNSESLFYKRHTLNNTLYTADNFTFRPLSDTASLAMKALLSNNQFVAETSPSYNVTTDVAPNARYLGRIFDLFILVEKGEELFIIDQHAAHELVLHERFLQGAIPKQELLVPIPFSTESFIDDNFLEEKQHELQKFGIVIRKEKDGWLIEALPSGWKYSDSETVAELLNLATAGSNFAERWAILLSCRAAIKDGDFLDETTALALAEEAFSIPAYRCPHGRPIWFAVSRRDLLSVVKRI